MLTFNKDGWLSVVEKTRGAKSAYARLMAKADKSTGCWLVTPYKMKNSYAVLYIRIEEGGPASLRASRFVWAMAKGVIPDRLMVCHTCDNPACINLDHLFLGTAEDNTLDAIVKGRAQTARHRKEVSRVHTGMKHSEKTKKEMSLRRISRKMGPCSPERKAKISASLKGRPLPSGTKAKISAGLSSFYANGGTHPQQGKSTPPEVKAKISAALSGRTSPTKGMKFPNRAPMSEETKQKISATRLLKRSLCK